MNYKLLIIISFVFVQNLFSQAEDPVLFSVEGNPVQLSEFEYIYTKNNGDLADYSQKSLEEYLDLYINFKLKVQRARELGLDTITSLKKELAGYRRQLADSYLVDNEVSEQLIKEVYDRKQHDLKVSHILILASKNANDNDVKRARAKIQTALESLKKGDDFKTVAMRMSEDKNSAAKGGDIGYVTSMLPDGFYEFENAIYNTPVGSYSDVIRSDYGFHIVKVDKKRSARGEMEVAHILIRKKYKGQEVENATAKVDSLHKVLQNGGNFEDVCKQHSQDTKTLNKGGYLGNFGINQYEIAFENAAFALKNDGDISKPVETKVGYHIIKRISKNDLSDYKTAQKRLKSIVSKADRFKIAKEALIDQIKAQGDFTENKQAYDNFVKGLDQEFFSYKWTPSVLSEETLISFNNGQKASIRDFANFCKKESRTRLRYNKNAKPSEAADALYDSFINMQAMKYEEANLEKKYPEFKALMREYREGILLFEATEREVWNKASSDTIGLKSFYQKNADNYQYKERAKVYEYTIKSTDAKKIKKIYKEAKKKSPKELMALFNKEGQFLSYKELILDKDNPSLDKLKKWKEKERSKPNVDIKKNQSVFYKVVEIMEPRAKKLEEARGYVISDYQDSLEKQWISDLKAKYKIEINQSVFDTLVKK